jgi:signal transduction histidine kinase
MMVDKVPFTNPNELLNSMKATANAIRQNPQPQANDLKNWTAAFQSYTEALDKGNLAEKKFAPAQFQKSLQEAVDAINLFQQNTQSSRTDPRNVDRTLIALVGALSKVMNSFVGKVRSLGEIKVENKGKKKVEKVDEGKDTDNKEKK